MAWIDEQGLILGRLNLVDGLVAIALALVIAGGVGLVLDASVGLFTGAIVTGVTVSLLVQRPPDEREIVEPTETRRVEVVVPSQPPHVVDSIGPGDETTAGDAVVRRRWTEPAKVVVHDDDGSLREDEHPWLATIWLSVDLELEGTDPPTFRGERLQIDDDVELALGHVTLEGTITRLDLGAEEDDSPDVREAIARAE